MCISLRLVTEKDCELLFKWKNDYSVRKSAFNSERVQYYEHKSWFIRKVNSDDTKIFIAIKNEEHIGQIRIDIEDNIGIIDYSIDSNHRRKGYGKEILIKVMDSIKNLEIDIDKLKGKVRYDNIQSQKTFLNAGYIEEKQANYIEYIKELR